MPHCNDISDVSRVWYRRRKMGGMHTGHGPKLSICSCLCCFSVGRLTKNSSLKSFSAGERAGTFENVSDGGVPVASLAFGC